MRSNFRVNDYLTANLFFFFFVNNAKVSEVPISLLNLFLYWFRIGWAEIFFLFYSSQQILRFVVRTWLSTGMEWTVELTWWDKSWQFGSKSNVYAGSIWSVWPISRPLNLNDFRFAIFLYGYSSKHFRCFRRFQIFVILMKSFTINS